MNLWVLIIIAILLYIYISYYYRYPSNVSIIQSALSYFDVNLLQEKQPIVLEDKIEDIQIFKKSWFKWNYTKYYQLPEQVPEKWYKNQYKYLIIQPQESIELYLCPANIKFVNDIPPAEETLIIMKLKAKQMVILPFHWKYMIQTYQPIYYLGVHDVLTPFLP